MGELTYPHGLDDGTVRLRPWADRDVGCVEQASADPEIPQGTTVPARYTLEEGLAFVRRQHARLTDGQGRLRSFLVLGETRSDALVYSRVAAPC